MLYVEVQGCVQVVMVQENDNLSFLQIKPILLCILIIKQ